MDLVSNESDMSILFLISKEDVIDIILVFSLSTLNILHKIFQIFHIFYYSEKCQKHF